MNPASPPAPRPSAAAVLAIETSTRAPSIALRLADGALTVRELDGEGAHASDLAPAVADLLGAAGVSAQDLRRLIVGTGPGSLTGLRVGAATAIGLARVVDAELWGVPSLAAVALASRDAGARGRLVHVHDIRGGHVAIAEFVAEDSELGLAWAPGQDRFNGIRPVAYAELVAQLERYESCTLIADRQVLERAGARPADLDRALEPCAPRAAGLARLEHLGAADVQPLYLRAFGS